MGRIDTYPAPNQLIPISGSTLAYAQATANQTGITTSAVDLIGLTVTLTVPAGRRIRITGKADFAQSVATVNVVEMRLMEGATQLQRAKLGDPDAQSESLVLEHVLTPSAGTHTYRLTAFTDAGTVTMVAASDLPAFIIVEDVTGSQFTTVPPYVPVGTLGYGQRTGNQTGIGTTPVLIGGLSVNVAVPSGRQLKITGFLPTFTKTSGAPTWVRAYIRRNGVDIQRTIESANNDTFTSLSIEHVDSPAAGSHTYEIFCDTDTGTVALDLGSVGAGANAFIVVEDITVSSVAGQGAPGSTLGYAEVTASQGSITSEVDLTGLSVTVTVPAGRRLKITAQCEFANPTANQNNRLRIKEGATALKIADTFNNTSSNEQQAIAEVVITPSAGSHTYKLTASTSAGTLTMVAGTSIPAFILVEDITGAVWPAGATVTSGLIASEPWTTWVPSVTQGVAVTSTVLTSRYIKMGRLVNCYMRINITSAGTSGQSVVISLPVPGFAHGGSGIPVGSGWIYDASANIMYEGSWGILGSGLQVDLATDATAGNDWGVAPAIGLASGDIISFHLTYEAAS